MGSKMTDEQVLALTAISSVMVFGAALVGLPALLRVWDSISAKYIGDLMPTIKALRLDESNIPIFLRCWGAALLGVAAICALLGAIPLAVPALLLVYLAPRLYLNRLIQKRRQLLRDQLVGAAGALANTMRAGLALPNGIADVAQRIEKPLANELNTIVNDFNRGLPLATALSRARDRLDLDSFSLFANALIACQERGGRITEALDSISHSLNENQRVERKLETEVAAGKKVVTILAIIPFVFLAIFLVIYPDGTKRALTETVGQIALAGAALLIFISVRWSQKILALDI